MTNITGSSPKSVFTEDGRLPDQAARGLLRDQDLHRQADRLHRRQPGQRQAVLRLRGAHQAPHDPYHLPRDWRNRHVGEYDKGWDAVRQERLKRQVEMGIMPAGTELAERMWFVPDPIVLAPASRYILGKKMELYAGMVENMDHHIGRLIDHLKKIGEYENTIFIFFGDNGAEGTDLFGMIAGSPGTRDNLFAAITWSQTHPMRGATRDPGSAMARCGPRCLMTPFQPVQGLAGRGRHPQRADRQRTGRQSARGSINHGLMHVADIMPTLLEVAGTSYPKASQPDLRR